MTSNMTTEAEILFQEGTDEDFLFETLEQEGMTVLGFYDNPSSVLVSGTTDRILELEAQLLDGSFPIDGLTLSKML